jgi:hypothetical protein
MRGWGCGGLRGAVATLVVATGPAIGLSIGLTIGAGAASAVSFPIVCERYDQELPESISADVPPTVGPTRTFTVSNIVASLPSGIPIPVTATDVYYAVGFDSPHATLVPGSVQAPAGVAVIPDTNGFQVMFPGPYRANPFEPPIRLAPVSASFTADAVDAATLHLEVQRLGLTLQAGGQPLEGTCRPKNDPQVIASTTVVNQPPVANALSRVIAASDVVTIAPGELASDPDDGLDPASFAITAAPAHGTATIDASGLHYTPNADFVQDHLQFKACDTLGACSIGSFLATAPGRNPPSAHDDTLTVTEGGSGSPVPSS